MSKIKCKGLIIFLLIGSVISTTGSCKFESKVSKESTIIPESEITSTKYSCKYWNKSIGKGSPDKLNNILVTGSELGDSGLGDLYEEKWDDCFVFLNKSKQILVIEVSTSWNSSDMNIINTQKKVLELDISSKKYIEKTIDIIGDKENFNDLTPMFHQDLATYEIETEPVVNRTIIYLEEAANSLKKEGSEWAKFDWRERVELDAITYEKLFPGKISKFNPELTQLTEGMPYSKVREILFNNGWKAHNEPIDESEYDRPTYQDLVINQGYKEYLFCSGTGLGICSFKFINDQHQSVEILTAGDPQGSVFYKISDLKTSPESHSKTDSLP
ncbi:hypothetical protein H6G76_21110 [Nostoc sp. FACHB-152]|uniref:hypothetical protein n=1 Tax=unclassified Nostoc TaxID=2593658 RepID=UPI00168215C7|nr:MULTISPECIES: hypothetical protein [unclassified Nostoc]MBD2449621.1 hypothetical protein [Nostoc sp. FACHB-152]MBD2468988.1 hypothetical protein [Nostoc sp. FACHB-145]